ncbi:MAG: hypothetical protein H6617_06100 [Bdellovibrionaceae bacterium]|nr:hypothetical protein [Bdellovibrionales bacterium]MCB9254236.1 hypothetical protein [Pseudobdellovibrionaceae bacterium]
MGRSVLIFVFFAIGVTQAFAGPSPVFSIRRDCQAVVWGNAGLCVSSDCRALSFHNTSFCTSGDCRAILYRNAGLCR